MRRTSLFFAALLVVVTATATRAAPDAAPVQKPGASTVIPLEGGEELSLEIPALEELQALGPKGKQRKAAWSGKIGTSKIWIELRAYPRAEMGFNEPDDVTDVVAETYSDPDDGGDPEFRWATRDLVQGQFGAAPYASLCLGPTPRKKGETGSTGELFVLGAVMDRNAYSIRLFMEPKVAEAERTRMRDFLAKGVKGKSKPRDTKWTAEEAKARWEKAVRDPDVLEGLKDITRTKHYIVFTNSSAGALFAKKMEECYAEIRKAYPFPEVEGRRLMPVFLFRMPEQYYDFCVHGGTYTLPQAQRSKGHAKKDYYATYYESPNDPVHIHEATHQIFRNRLRLSGGGSWFQEGLAEYMETSHNDRKAWARRATRDGKFCHFTEFVQIPSLLQTPGVEADDAYHQAGSVIEFLRDGDFHPDVFPKFVAEIGALPRGNLVRIQQAVQTLYGTDLAGIEKEWVAYWKK